MPTQDRRGAGEDQHDAGRGLLDALIQDDESAGERRRQRRKQKRPQLFPIDDFLAAEYPRRVGGRHDVERQRRRAPSPASLMFPGTKIRRTRVFCRTLAL
jgi:hypothetical protein